MIAASFARQCGGEREIADADIKAECGWFPRRSLEISCSGPDATLRQTNRKQLVDSRYMRAGYRRLAALHRLSHGCKRWILPAAKSAP